MREDVRFAAATRDAGLRRVRGLTFRIGAAALASSAAIAVAFSHLSGAASASSQSAAPGSPGGGGTNSAGSARPGSGAPGGAQPGGAQSGGAQPGSSGQGSAPQGSNSLQAPAQNVQPAQGPAHGVSGGS